MKNLASLLGALPVACASLAFADAISVENKKSTLDTLSIWMFATFVAITLHITKRAAKRPSAASHTHAAGDGIAAFQNGLAIVGGYMRAVSSLGI